MSAIRIAHFCRRSRARRSPRRAEFAIVVLLAWAQVPIAHAQDLGEALTGGRFSVDLRYRFEAVDQANALRNARAWTLRGRGGYETGAWHGFSAMLEAEAVVAVGNDRYNSTVNGKTGYSVVADPEDAEINQAWLRYGGLPGTRVTYGRQRLMLDNQRFIGAVGWRQNEQTFDALWVVNESLPYTRLTAGYVYNVNRVFGDKSAVGNFKSASPIVHASYKGFAAGELSGYGYLLDFPNTAANSTRTWGLRFKGATDARKDLKLLYAAEYASQHDWRDNPRRTRVRYHFLEGGVALKGVEVKLGHETLGSDGTNAFQTPLATLHAFNGWADQFLATPATGLRDTHLKAGATVAGVRLDAIVHRFRADRGGARYGSEWDLQAVLQYRKHYAVGIKYASYDAKSFSVDTDKLWLWVEAKF